MKTNDERIFEEEEMELVTPAECPPHTDLPPRHYEGYDDDFPITLDAPLPETSIEASLDYMI